MERFLAGDVQGLMDVLAPDGILNPHKLGRLEKVAELRR